MNTPDPAQLKMNWLFPHFKPSLRPDEVAAVCGMSVDQVVAHCDCGNFASVEINDNPLAEKAGTAKRKHRRILRFTVEAWWLNKLEAEGIDLPVEQSQELVHWRERLKNSI